jgi:hypothetical protein
MRGFEFGHFFLNNTSGQRIRRDVTEHPLYFCNHITHTYMKRALARPLQEVIYEALNGEARRLWRQASLTVSQPLGHLHDGLRVLASLGATPYPLASQPPDAMPSVAL